MKKTIKTTALILVLTLIVVALADMAIFGITVYGTEQFGIAILHSYQLTIKYLLGDTLIMACVAGFVYHAFSMPQEVPTYSKAG